MRILESKYYFQLSTDVLDMLFKDIEVNTWHFLGEASQSGVIACMHSKTFTLKKLRNTMACISISLSSSCSSLGSEEMLTNASGCGYRTDLRQLEDPRCRLPVL